MTTYTEQLREEFNEKFQFKYEAGDDTREEETQYWLSKHNDYVAKIVEEIESMTPIVIMKGDMPIGEPFLSRKKVLSIITKEI